MELLSEHSSEEIYIKKICEHNSKLRDRLSVTAIRYATKVTVTILNT